LARKVLDFWHANNFRPSTSSLLQSPRAAPHVRRSDKNVGRGRRMADDRSHMAAAGGAMLMPGHRGRRAAGVRIGLVAGVRRSIGARRAGAASRQAVALSFDGAKKRAFRPALWRWTGSTIVGCGR
jgi:hypothetical protein